MSNFTRKYNFKNEVTREKVQVTPLRNRCRMWSYDGLDISLFHDQEKSWYPSKELWEDQSWQLRVNLSGSHGGDSVRIWLSYRNINNDMTLDSKLCQSNLVDVTILRPTVQVFELAATTANHPQCPQKWFCDRIQDLNRGSNARIQAINPN